MPVFSFKLPSSMLCYVYNMYNMYFVFYLVINSIQLSRNRYGRTFSSVENISEFCIIRSELSDDSSTKESNNKNDLCLTFDVFFTIFWYITVNNYHNMFEGPIPIELHFYVLLRVVFFINRRPEMLSGTAVLYFK